MRVIYLISLLLSFNLSAKKITEFTPYQYEVFFTNPICNEYQYEKPVYSNDGELISTRVQNVYCTKEDKDKNINRLSSPNYNIRKLISDPKVTEMFFTYLSFSDEDVANELCHAIEQRNLKVTFIIDSKNNLPSRKDKAMELFEKIKKCKSNLPNANKARMEIRGNIGGLGFAHNKLILAHYKNSKKVTIVFGSANMSTGTWFHHENWHFLTTSKETHFYKAHECLRVGMLEFGESIDDFEKYVKECRSKITEEKEEDIALYIVPSDGKEAMDNIVENISKADSIDIAVHRFSNSSMISAIVKEAKNKKIRFIADDDLYWSGVLQKRVAANTKNESDNVKKIEKAGVEVRYMQTNHSVWQLHHNKFVIFNYDNGESYLHTGAGNFTYSAFSKNYENFYFIKIPSIVEKFKIQYEKMFNELATSIDKLPATFVK